jgi:hypothetical protein
MAIADAALTTDFARRVDYAVEIAAFVKAAASRDPVYFEGHLAIPTTPAGKFYALNLLDGLTSKGLGRSQPATSRTRTTAAPIGRAPVH